MGFITEIPRFELQITLSEPTYRTGRLVNEFAEPTASITKIEYYWHEDEVKEDDIVFVGNVFTLICNDFIKRYEVNESLTLSQLMVFIMQFEKERRTRPSEHWFGGIDVHHTGGNPSVSGSVLLFTWDS